MSNIIEALKAAQGTRGAYALVKHTFPKSEVEKEGFEFINPREERGVMVCDLIAPKHGIRLVVTGDVVSATTVVIKESTGYSFKNDSGEEIVIKPGTQKVYLY